MTTLKPQKAQIKQVLCWLALTKPHNYCNIDKAPRNSSGQNLTRKIKDWRDWTYTDGSLQKKNEVGQDTGSGVYHPHLNVSHYVNPKGMGITNNQHHLTCRASSYSSCSHTRLFTYSHRQPYTTAPNQKAALKPESPSPPHPRRFEFESCFLIWCSDVRLSVAVCE